MLSQALDSVEGRRTTTDYNDTLLRAINCIGEKLSRPRKVLLESILCVCCDMNLPVNDLRFERVECIGRGCILCNDDVV